MNKLLGFTFLVLVSFSNIACASVLYNNATDAPHLKLIQSAKSKIDIEIYTMNDPSILQALLDAQSRGVKIRIVQEPTPVGASCKIFKAPAANEPANCSQLRAFYQQVIKNGGEYVPYEKNSFCNGTKVCFEHGKLLIIDQKNALISTGNFDVNSICDLNNGASKCNRDYSVVMDEQNKVQTLAKIFENDLKGKPYDLTKILSDLPDHSLTASPYSMEPLVQFIGSAQKTIQIQNQYLKDPTLNAAIMEAGRRGVKIQVMVSSICSFGRASTNEMAKTMTLAKDYESAGIEARVFTKKIHIGGITGYLHAKAILVDGKTAWVGSVNGSTTALTVNREFGVFLNDAKNISTLSSLMSSDFSNPGSISLAEDATCGN